MNEGRIIFQVNKVGFAFNNKWNVLLDGKYIGQIDFKNDLKVNVPNGRHSVQYKVGVQTTQVLEVNVEDDDVIVECLFDGTVKNFHVVGQAETSVQFTQTEAMSQPMEQQLSNQTVQANQVVQSSNYTEPIQKKSKWKTWLIVSVVVLILCAIFAGNSEDDGKYSVSNKVIESAESKAKSIVTQAYKKVPECKSECIWKGKEDCIVKVAYKTENGNQGTIFLHVELSNAYTYDGHYYYNQNKYDIDMSEEEIEVAVAEWELK